MVFALATLPAVGSDALPAPVAKELEGRKGICLDLDCGGGKLAAAIAQASDLTVFALAANDKDCQAAREAMDKAGSHGGRATVAVGSPKRVPLPNGYCNLIVAGQLPRDTDFNEIARLLNPNGVAVVGGADADTGRLRSQAVQAGTGDCKVDGGYLVIRGKMPAGSDDWTHGSRGPDNNMTSLDASIRPPFRTQWLASYYGHIVAARGRVLIKPHTYHNASLKKAKFLVRDGLNGTALWEREVRDWGYWPDDVLMVGDKVYAIEDRQNLSVLDAGTGRQLATFRVPAGSDAESAYWRSIAFQDNVLYVVASKVDGKVEMNSPLTRMGYTPKQGFSFGPADRFFALDASDGRLLWVHKAEPPTRLGSFALGPQAAFFISESGILAIDLKTGARLWHNPDVGAKPQTRCLPLLYHDGKVHCFWVPDGSRESGGSATLDAKTGALAYAIPDLKGLTSNRNQLCIGNTLYVATGNGFTGCYEFNTYDSSTGQRLPESFRAPSSNGCRPFSGTPSSLGGQFGIMDLKTREWFFFDTGRIDCVQGLVYANGLAYYSHTYGYPCPCPYPVRGTVTMSPAGAWRPPKAPDVKNTSAERLAKGPAFDAPLAADAGPDDWPYYRHDACRSARASGAVKLPADKGWQQRLSGTLTPAAAAAGLVFTGSSDGRLWALDAGSGKIVWTYLCGSEVKVTPTYWRGRLFAGSADGWVHCLEAKTGSLVWRFQAAPETRFVSAKGRLNSMWPVLGGVVVDDDTAHFVAGMCSIDGAYLYGVSAATGQVRWVRDIGHLSETPRLDPKNGGAGPKGGFIGINPYGALALNRGLLYVPNGRARPGVFEKTDGDVVSWPGMNRDGVSAGGGQVVVAGDTIFIGGDALIGTDGPGPMGSGDPLNAFLPFQASSGQAHAVGGTPFSLGKATPAPTPAATYVIKGKRDGTYLVAYSPEKLAAVFPAKDKDRPAAETEATLWATKNTPILLNDGYFTGMAIAHSIVTAGPQVLVAGTSEVFVYDETGQTVLAKFKVQGTIRRNGLSVAQGGAYVVTEEGGVACLGAENR